MSVARTSRASVDNTSADNARAGLPDLAQVGCARPAAAAAEQPDTTSPAPEPPAVIGEPLAEAAVLGCILRATSAQARSVLGLLGEDCWSVPQHAHVAAAARALLARDEPVDPVTVLGQLRRQGVESARTASTDAGVFLVELCQAAPSVSSAAYYARIVLEHAYRRRVQAAALRLLQAADTAGLTDLGELVDREHAAVTRAGHRASAPDLLRALPPS